MDLSTDPDVLVVADAAGVLSVAGIMGSPETEDAARNPSEAQKAQRTRWNYLDIDGSV
jgi:hypothetical protein